MFQISSSFSIIEQNKNSGKFEVSGLYPGYGITLGNALRRVLISSIEGAAVTSFKVEGAPHEFTSLEGIKETMIDIMLNLKQLAVKLYTDEPQTIQLSVTGEKEVKAKDFASNSQVEITNPDLHLATLTDKKASLELEATIEKGLGYVPVEMRKKEKLPVGVIPVDAIFSPIEQVNVEVEDMRVGDRTDYNRLIITINTNGTITPLEAFSQAISILEGHFELLKEKINLLQPEKETKLSLENKIDKEPKEILIEDLPISTRTKKVLINNGIKTLAGLLRYREDNLTKLEGLGDKSISEIKEVLQNIRFTLKP